MKSYTFFVQKVQDQIVKRQALPINSLYSDCICPREAEAEVNWSSFFLDVYLDTNKSTHLEFVVPANASVAALNNMAGALSSGYSLQLAFGKIWPMAYGPREVVLSQIQSSSLKQSTITSLDDLKSFRKQCSNKNLTYHLELSPNQHLIGTLKSHSYKITNNPFINNLCNSKLVSKHGFSVPIKQILKTHIITVFEMPLH